MSAASTKATGRGGRHEDDDSLRAHGTNTDAELVGAQLALAVQLLVATPLKIEAIAREVGFASKAWFIARIRAATGHTPGALRELLARPVTAR